MAKTFTITTTAPDSIKTDAKGHAEAVYTVTNSTSRPVRGMGKAVALDSTKQEWLNVTGEADRDFAAGSTQQFVVTFDMPVAAPAPGAKPPATDASADKYAFRLVVASATNPDEDFTEGQTIRVETPKAAGPTPTNGGFPKWILIPIAVVVLAGIGIGLWLALRKSEPKKFQVPDVAGVAEADARTSLETGCEAGADCLAVTVSQVADKTVAKGNALGTDPVAGTEVDPGSAVTLLISSGPEVNPVETFKIPAVANVAQAAAQSSLEKGCKKQEGCVQVEVSSVSDPKIPTGMAIRTEPEAGVDVEVGSKVTMFVSKGPDKVTLQNVANQTAEQAMDTLEKACSPAPCVDVEVNRIADNNVAAGRVIGTRPAAGSVVNAGSKVMLLVSGGTDQVTIPAVLGKTGLEARQLLVNACRPTPCLQATVTNQNSDTVPAGQAIGTVPARGNSVKIGSTIVLNISSGPEVKLVGTYTKMTEAAARARIAADGFRVGSVKRIPIIFSTSAVTAQDPAPGSRRAKGTLINLTVVGK